MGKERTQPDRRIDPWRRLVRVLPHLTEAANLSGTGNTRQTCGAAGTASDAAIFCLNLKPIAATYLSDATIGRLL
jgi:hypothetical protein